MSALQQIKHEFIQRADAYAARAGISRVTVSKKLFGQTSKLADLAEGRADVATSTLDNAITKLGQLEAELEVGSASDPPSGQVQA